MEKRELLASGHLADATIRVDDAYELRVHRALLVVQSSFFSRVFNDDTTCLSFSSASLRKRATSRAVYVDDDVRKGECVPPLPQVALNLIRSSAYGVSVSFISYNSVAIFLHAMLSLHWDLRNTDTIQRSLSGCVSRIVPFSFAATLTWVCVADELQYYNVLAEYHKLLARKFNRWFKDESERLAYLPFVTVAGIIDLLRRSLPGPQQRGIEHVLSKDQLRFVLQWFKTTPRLRFSCDMHCLLFKIPSHALEYDFFKARCDECGVVDQELIDLMQVRETVLKRKRARRARQRYYL